MSSLRPLRKPPVEKDPDKRAWDEDVYLHVNGIDLIAPVPSSRKVNGHPLTSDVTVTKSDVGLSNVPNLSFSGSNTGDETKTTILTKVDGDFAAQTGAATISAAGSNQNVTLTPSGSGNSILNGNVGINVSSPLFLVHASGTDPAIVIDGYDASTSPTPQFMTRAARGTASSPSAIQTDDTIGGFSARAYGATAFSSTTKANVEFGASENWTDSAQGTYIQFRTTATGTTTKGIRMRISPNGDVGIGTTSPIGLLTLNASTYLSKIPLQIICDQGGRGFRVHTSDFTTGVGSTLNVFPGAATGNTYYAIQGYTNGENSANGDLCFCPSGGNVGIGTTSPSSLLDVNGTARIGDHSTNYSSFAADGELNLVGTARVKKEIIIPATRQTLGASAPTAGTRAVGASGNVYVPVLKFSKTVEQETYFEVHMPAEMDDSVNVAFHLMWFPGASWTSGNYMWKLDYLVKSESDNLSTGTPTTISADVTPSAATDCIETEFATTIDANVMQTIWCRLWRDVSNDNADDVGEIRFAEVEYTSNKLGEAT